MYSCNQLYRSEKQTANLNHNDYLDNMAIVVLQPFVLETLLFKILIENFSHHF